MRFTELPLSGAFVIELEKNEDERGFFARFFCRNEYEELGLDSEILQINNSFSRYKGTLRGIHYQLPPMAEVKIVRCVTGAIWDLIVDLREKSPTFGEWFGIDLSANNRKMMYVPKGFGHGNISLEDNTEIIYLVTERYSSSHERIARWDDQKFGIEWPLKPIEISDKDKSAPDFNVDYHFKSDKGAI